VGVAGAVGVERQRRRVQDDAPVALAPDGRPGLVDQLSVPVDATPGTYTLRVRTDSDTDYQTFEVVAEKRATLTLRAVSRDTVVVDATLPDGGYVELRADGAVYGVSPYLSPGTHTSVSIPVDAGATSLTAVAVVGTADRRLEAYTAQGDTVTVTVGLPTATPAATPTLTPTAEPSPMAPPITTASPTRSPTRTRTTTDATGPGFGVVSAVLAFVGMCVYRQIR